MYREMLKKASNGVSVYFYKNPNLHSFYISLFVRAGSMFEQTPGITHFLEHAAIRNVSAIMQGGLYSTLDTHGVEFNAYTYSEMIQFYVSGATAKFKLGGEIISRLLSPIILSPTDIKAERDRIKAEIREGDDASSLATFSNNVVHEGTSLARIITGTVGSVNKITASRLEEYRRSVMTSENMFFYVTGNFSDSDIDRLLEDISSYPVEKGEKQENIAPVSLGFGRRDGRVYLKNADFTMLRFTFDMDMDKMNVNETDLLYDMLLSGYNSRFFIEMSEKRGLFYDISGSSERYKNIGSFVFSFEVRSGSVYEAVEKVVEILNDFKSRVQPEQTLMKAGYVDNARLLYDDPRELNFTFGYDNHIMNAGYCSVEDRADRYDKVTPERIKEVAESLFVPSNLTLTVKGKKKKVDLQKLEDILKKL